MSELLFVFFCLCSSFRTIAADVDYCFSTGRNTNNGDFTELVTCQSSTIFQLLPNDNGGITYTLNPSGGGYSPIDSNDIGYCEGKFVQASSDKSGNLVVDELWARLQVPIYPRNSLLTTCLPIRAMTENHPAPYFVPAIRCRWSTFARIEFNVTIINEDCATYWVSQTTIPPPFPSSTHSPVTLPHTFHTIPIATTTKNIAKSLLTNNYKLFFVGLFFYFILI